MSDALSLRGIKKSYANDGVVTSVLHGIDLEIPHGQFISIMGPSGSGKSTLMNILGLLDTPSEGVYQFGDRDVSRLTDDELSAIRGERIGFIFQTFNLLPKTSVRDNVMLPLLYSRIPTNKRQALADEAIAAVGLSHRAENLSNQLSGGERQRVAIARALIRNPQVILADEPTGNLDSKSGKQVMDILYGLNEKRGHTVILVTHETYTAEYAERIVRLKDGVVESDLKSVNRRRPDDGKELK
ncbi:MAG: hypothetical protein RL141_1083 [Candidatus Parcubacteria bacterium]|jgi:putative ABC transport system ATP-binding protein